ncbi:hypothetical protein FGU65_03005 [Methanoculleus sp. FWC-SCC1]|uniref:DUF4198 domain-containing protein n=1 Tax=Methanoculleus frigidifontis TaxID=2584085 RepID=A0ABT8M7K0_9EURY|nr:hypothetical protein [Methanoculleus sp. FWC-SCC1]MDN7023869.1 hypothetical protein [Methanoculleus sp. FWC-SCC1]
MTTRSGILGIIICCCILLPAVSAHVPIMVEGDTDRLSAATIIEDPTKSWVVYARLSGNDTVDYYRFRMEEGDLIRLSLQTPEEGAFAPGMVLMGAGITEAGAAPPAVTVPGGAGATAIPGTRPDQPFFEPFTPAKSYRTAEVSLAAPETGDYVVAVYATEGSGPYALAVGTREQYTLTEWLTIPLDVIAIHLWEGQSLAFILSPLAAVVALGVALIAWQRRGALSAFGWTAALAGLLYIGSGAMTLTQLVIALMGPPLTAAALVTLIAALIPILLGALMLAVGLRRSAGSRTDRIIVAVLGVLGLATWAGVLAGPVLAVIAAVLPASRKGKT